MNEVILKIWQRLREEEKRMEKISAVPEQLSRSRLLLREGNGAGKTLQNNFPDHRHCLSSLFERIPVVFETLKNLLELLARRPRVGRILIRETDDVIARGVLHLRGAGAAADLGLQHFLKLRLGDGCRRNLRVAKTRRCSRKGRVESEAHLKAHGCNGLGTLLLDPVVAALVSRWPRQILLQRGGRKSLPVPS